MIVQHDQTTDLKQLSFQRVEYALSDTDLFVTGDVELKGESYRVSNDYSLAEPFTVFLHLDGTVSTDATNAFATMAWWDGTDLHVINHVEAANA